MRTTTPLPAVERFLLGYHDARPGLTTQAFAALPVEVDGTLHASSYELLAAALDSVLRPAAVLDLACGDGFLLTRLAARGGNALALHGVDLSTGELSAARQRLGERATLCRARAQALPYVDACFDVVTSHMALMLMPDAPQVLAEVRRVLKPGGRFAAVIGVRSPPSPALSHYLAALSRHARDARWSDLRFGDPGWRNETGLREALHPGFGSIETRAVRLAIRQRPEALWAWLQDLYDLHLLCEADRDAVREDFLAGARADADAHGELLLEQALLQFEATAC